MLFFVLSQAPPVFALEVAIWSPEIIIPFNSLATAFGPNNTPVSIGIA